MRQNKWIYSINENQILIHLDQNQLKDYSMVTKLIVIDKEWNLKYKTDTIAYEDYHSFLYDNFTLGKKYEIIKRDSVDLIKTEFGKLDLEMKFPINKEYDTRNIDFDDKNLVLFHSQKDRLTIYKYEWKTNLR